VRENCMHGLTGGRWPTEAMVSRIKHRRGNPTDWARTPTAWRASGLPHRPIRQRTPARGAARRLATGTPDMHADMTRLSSHLPFGGSAQRACQRELSC